MLHLTFTQLFVYWLAAVGIICALVLAAALRSAKRLAAEVAPVAPQSPRSAGRHSRGRRERVSAATGPPSAAESVPAPIPGPGPLPGPRRHPDTIPAGIRLELASLGCSDPLHESTDKTPRPIGRQLPATTRTTAAEWSVTSTTEDLAYSWIGDRAEDAARAFLRSATVTRSAPGSWAIRSRAVITETTLTRWQTEVAR